MSNKKQNEYLIEYYGWEERHGCGDFVPMMKKVISFKEVVEEFEEYYHIMTESENEELISRFKVFQLEEVSFEYFIKGQA